MMTVFLTEMPEVLRFGFAPLFEGVAVSRKSDSVLLLGDDQIFYLTLPSISECFKLRLDQHIVQSSDRIYPHILSVPEAEVILGEVEIGDGWSLSPTTDRLLLAQKNSVRIKSLVGTGPEFDLHLDELPDCVLSVCFSSSEEHIVLAASLQTDPDFETTQLFVVNSLSGACSRIQGFESLDEIGLIWSDTTQCAIVQNMNAPEAWILDPVKLELNPVDLPSISGYNPFGLDVDSGGQEIILTATNEAETNYLFIRGSIVDSGIKWGTVCALPGTPFSSIRRAPHHALYGSICQIGEEFKICTFGEDGLVISSADVDDSENSLGLEWTISGKSMIAFSDMSISLWTP